MLPSGQIVSIPFKRDNSSELKNASCGEAVNTVSIPFKRDNSSEHDATEESADKPA